MIRLGISTTRRAAFISRKTILGNRYFSADISLDSTENAQNGEQLKQAPNRPETWAPSQNPRRNVVNNPRFLQHDLLRQPNPPAAIELIAKEPIRFLDAYTAVCDGEKGSQQGHPRIFIDIDKPGAHSCTYCGLRYAHIRYKDELTES